MEPVIPKEGQWIARPQRTIRWYHTTTMMIVICQVPWVLHFLLGKLVGDNAAWGLSLLAGIALIAALRIFGPRWGLVRRREGPDAALTDLDSADHFRVEVNFSSRGVDLGSDRGVLWFEEGLMGFSGAATSFVLAAGDLSPNWAEARRGKRDPRYPTNAILLPRATQNAYFEVFPIGDGKAFLQRFELFMAQNEASDAARIWPPLVPYAQALP